MRQGPEAAANGVSVVGLRNATGEYNCFLNVIIQCLWHCHDFRTQVMEWPAAAYEVGALRCQVLACGGPCLISVTAINLNLNPEILT